MLGLLSNDAVAAGEFAVPRAYPTWVEPRLRGVPRYGAQPVPSEAEGGLFGMRGIFGRPKPIPHPE